MYTAKPRHGWDPAECTHTLRNGKLCGFMAESLDVSSRKGSGWSQHVKQNPNIVIVCHFFRFAPFCEPALNKVTRMLNLSSLFSKFLFSSHWYLSLSSSFFVSFLASRGLGLTLHSILSVWCSLSGLVWSGLVWSWFRLTVVLVLVLGLLDT